jgi:mono/diheme cytochrome c family protein
MSRHRYGLICIAVLFHAHAFAADNAQQVSQGREVFNTWCAACHAHATPASARLAGTMVLEQKYKGAKPAALEDRTDLTSAFVAAIVRNGVGPMPFFRKTEVSDADLKALGAYLSRKSRP